MNARNALKAYVDQQLPRLPSVLLGSPPRGFELADYKRWFPTSARYFLRYLERPATLEFPAATGVPIGVMIAPWVSTPTPWYCVMLAIGLRRRGRRVILIWDDTGFAEDDCDHQNKVIGSVLDRVSPAIEVVRLSAGLPADSQPDDALSIDALARQNLTWRLRGGVQTEADQPALVSIRAALTKTLPYIRAALDATTYSFLVVPGGVYGSTGLFRREAAALGLRVSTFDSDQGVGQLCVDGVAAQNGDIARAFQTLWRADHGTRAAAVAVAKEEFRLRTQSTDGYGFQTGPAVGAAAGTGEHGVLMPMNVEWDTAALGKHVNFTDTVDWLTATIPVILEAGGGPVTVRQHPSERRSLQRSRLAIGAILQERFGGDARVRFVAAEDPVNSYDLLNSAEYVLPFVSTIAVEAAAMGKLVLISGDAYYAQLGFVRHATSQEEYLDSVRRMVSGEFDLLPAQRDRAWICFYLTAVRNRIPTDFTPHPADFWSWSRRDPDMLFADPEVADMITAIDTDEPVSLLRHKRLASTGPAS